MCLGVMSVEYSIIRKGPGVCVDNVYQLTNSYGSRSCRSAAVLRTSRASFRGWCMRHEESGAGWRVRVV